MVGGFFRAVIWTSCFLGLLDGHLQEGFTGGDGTGGGKARRMGWCGVRRRPLEKRCWKWSELGKVEAFVVWIKYFGGKFLRGWTKAELFLRLWRGEVGKTLPGLRERDTGLLQEEEELTRAVPAPSNPPILWWLDHCLTPWACQGAYTHKCLLHRRVTQGVVGEFYPTSSMVLATRRASVLGSRPESCVDWVRVIRGRLQVHPWRQKINHVLKPDQSRSPFSR